MGVHGSRHNIRVPELPDVVVYIEALRARVVGHSIEAVQLKSPFVLRSVDPPLDIVCGHPSTAQHVARRLCRKFVADPPPEGTAGTQSALCWW